MKLKKTFVALALLAVVAGVSGYCLSAGGYPPAVTLTTQEVHVTNTFLEGMTTRCVGRYLIDMPAAFIVTSDSIMAFIDKAPVKIKRLPRPAFEQKIRLREEALRKETTVDPQDMPLLKQVYPLPEGMEGIIFERNENQSVPDSVRILEAHLYTHGVAIEVTVTAANGLASRYDADRKEYPEIYGNTVPEKLTELIWLLKRMSGKKDIDIPWEPGFCLPEVFIADGTVATREELDVIFTSGKYAKAKFSLSTDNFIKAKNTMLDRRAEIDKGIAAAEGRTLQKGKRDINGLYTEEWLSYGNIDEDVTGLRFVLQANEAVTKPDSPRMYLSFLQRGQSGSSQLSEPAAVSAWEHITATLRLRPGAFKK